MSIDTNTNLKQVIFDRLTAKFSPIELEVLDESAAHVGHSGSANGGQHFYVRIVSAQFSDINILQRHRLIYNVMLDLIPHPIHALRIEACSY